MSYTTVRLYAGKVVKALRSLNYAERGYLIGAAIVIPADIAGIVAHLMGAI